MCRRHCSCEIPVESHHSGRVLIYIPAPPVGAFGLLYSSTKLFLPLHHAGPYPATVRYIPCSFLPKPPVVVHSTMHARGPSHCPYAPAGEFGSSSVAMRNLRTLTFSTGASEGFFCTFKCCCSPTKRLPGALFYLSFFVRARKQYRDRVLR